MLNPINANIDQTAITNIEQKNLLDGDHTFLCVALNAAALVICLLTSKIALAIIFFINTARFVYHWMQSEIIERLEIIEIKLSQTVQDLHHEVQSHTENNDTQGKNNERQSENIERFEAKLHVLTGIAEIVDSLRKGLNQTAPQ